MIAHVLDGSSTWHVEHGDSRDVLRAMPDACIDAVVCDPPYELGFMGKAWDASGIAYRVDLWREVLRVLKPGGHLLAFGGTRTYHRMACAIEDAGFEIRDSIHWIYGSGFPKSLDVSKAIDKAAGVEREIVGVKASLCLPSSQSTHRGFGHGIHTSPDDARNITAPATESAHRWNGWGTALKPAHEPVVMARKPLDGTVASNVERHGTGAINVDGGRIATGEGDNLARANAVGQNGWKNSSGGLNAAAIRVAEGLPALGRWPANVILGCVCEAEHKAGCPVMEMDEQSGERPGMSGGGAHRSGYAGGMFGAIDCTHTARGDTGGASRFFYCAKANRSERDAGLTGPIVPAHEVCNREEGSAGAAHPRAGARTERRNTHPTVKPIALMRYLVRLVTPPGGLVLDPFTGSGTTGCAAVLEGFRFLGFEREAEYAAIARARIEYRGGPSEDAPKREPELTTERQLSLF